jgi:hypothetical protein
VWQRARPRTPGPPGPAGGAILARLRRVRPAEASTIGALLGFGGPKRLVVTFLAMASISAAGLGDVERLALVALYVGVGTAVVWVPVAMMFVAGDDAADDLRRGEAWVASHAAVLRVWFALGLGATLVVDGLLRLLG